MDQGIDTTTVENVVRALAAAGRSLRLYPATSSIPQQSVAAAASALNQALVAEPVLAISIARDGLSWHGAHLGAHTPGASELADSLRNHGVAEVAFLPGATANDIIKFLEASGGDPSSVLAQGGLSAIMVAEGVESIRVVDVTLTVVDTSALGPSEDEDFDDFLRDLSQNRDKLVVWLGAAAHGDPSLLEEGLSEIARTVPAGGNSEFLESLAWAFMQQDPESKDAFLGLAIKDDSGVRSLAAGMFGFLGSGDIAGSILEGSFGRNMLSLSNALTSLPLERVTSEVRAEVQALLPRSGHTEHESNFLNHMLEVRSRVEPEPALVDADSTFRAVAQASILRDEDVERARNAVGASGSAMNAAGVRTMLALLDQQQDFELYCAGAQNLAAMVPRLIENGDLALAAKVLSELSLREIQTTGPWPELSERLREAIAQAASPRAMSALVRAVVADRSQTPAARDIMRHAGADAGPPLVAEAITLKAEGLEVAEELVGRRIIDLLNAQAGSAQWFQLGPIVMRLAREGDPRSTATIEALLRRTDEQSRREVVTALGVVGGPVALRALTAALNDPSAEVAIVAARSLGRMQAPGTAAALSARLASADIDNADFLLARELIAVLARSPEPEADAALNKLASRRSLMKRGHFAEIQALIAQAIAARKSGGAR